MKSVLLLLIVSFVVFPFHLRAQSTEIIFVSNVNGVVKNCGCGDPSLGGIARIITLVQEERKKNPNLLLIDGGDFFNPYSYPDLNRTVCEQYGLLKPNILMPGDQEIVEGISFFESYGTITSKIILASNIKNTFSNKLSTFWLNKQILFLSYLDISSFDLIKKPIDLQLSEHRFARAYNQYRHEHKLVAIFHGTEKGLNRFLKTYPDVDVVLWGHAQSNALRLDDKPAVVGGGTDGAFLNKIILHLRGTSLNVKVQKIPVGLSVYPNEKALKIINKWNIH